jgi:uncharacterized protein YegL
MSSRKDRQRRSSLVMVFVIGAALILLVLALAFGGAGGSGTMPSVQPSTNTPDQSSINPPSVTDYQPSIPDTTKVLSASTTQNLTSISADDVFYTFSQTTDELNDVKAGDVIVSSITPLAPYGFLRRVVSVRQESGQVIFETGAAALTDAIQAGTIKYRKKLTPADVASISNSSGSAIKFAKPAQIQDDFYIRADGLVLYDKDDDYNTPLDQVRVNLEYRFSPDIILEFSIHDFEIQQAHFELDTKDIVTTQFEYGIDQNIEGQDAPKIAKEFANYEFTPIVLYIGPVPVVFSPRTSMVVGLDGKIKLGLTMSVTHTVEKKNGLVYDKNSGWQTISESKKTFNPLIPDVTANADIELKGYIGPRLSILLYGNPGVYATLRLYVECDYSFIDKNTDWYVGLDIDIGFKVNTFGRWFERVTVMSGYRVLLNPKMTPSPTPPVATFTPTHVTSITVTSPPPPISSYETSSTVMLFDVSNSMNEPDVTRITKLDSAKGAGARILDIVQAENSAFQNAEIGILSFSSGAGANLPLSTDVQAARDALDGLYANGATNMADGLRLSIDQFQIQTNRKPIIILLSDGMPNIGLGGEDLRYDPDRAKQQVLDIASDAGSKGICIYTVGFGVPNTIGSVSGDASIDEGFLTQVAANSKCGMYYNAQNATDLANVYVKLRHKSLGTVLLETKGDIAQGQTVDLGVAPVSQGTDEMVFTLNWSGSRLDPTAIDPNGKIVDQNYPGASFFKSKSLASVIINNPVAGNWTFKAFGAEVPEGVLKYQALASARRIGNMPLSVSGEFPAALVVVPLLIGMVLTYIFVVSSKRDQKQYGKTARIGSTVATLYIVSGSGAGRSFSVRDNAVIGRSRISNIYIADPSVSRRHARFRFANGQWFIQDMGSSGGVYLNGARINASVLKSGDHIRIGATEFQFQ